MKIVLVRQRPSIGDCLLLAPITRALKRRYPRSSLTCVTDGSYAYGGLTESLLGLPGVDRVESVSPFIWTTESNVRVDERYRAAPGPAPFSVQNADLLLDANGGFIEFERAHDGKPPYGISEFWMKHFDLKIEEPLLPEFKIPDWAEAEAEAFMPEGKCVGIVLRSGHACRDWDYDGKARLIATWLHTTGYVPIGIDPGLALNCSYGKSCNGKRFSTVAGIVKRCAAVLTPDTGILHLAQAVGTPTVSLWGIMPPELRAKGYNTLTLPKGSKGVCGPERPRCECQWKWQRWSCLRRITPTEIIAALETTLKKHV